MYSIALNMQVPLLKLIQEKHTDCNQSEIGSITRACEKQVTNSKPTTVPTTWYLLGDWTLEYYVE